MTAVVATYFWTPDPGSKFTVPYTPDDVRLLQRMVARNTTVPHQFAVITDRPEAFADDRDIMATPLDRATHVPGTCFVRLMTFHPNGREMIGEKVLQIDLDTVIVGNIDHLLAREDDLVLWRNPARLPWADLDSAGLKQWCVARGFAAADLEDIDFSQKKTLVHIAEDGTKTCIFNQMRTHYNTSVLLHRCGSMPELWERFDPRRPPAKDDQWYLSDLFGMNAPGYFDGARDGVYRLPRDDTPDPLWVDGQLPANACIVTFPGSNGKPNAEIMADNPWIGECRR